MGKERERLEHTVLLALTLERLTTKAVVSVGGGKGGRKDGRTAISAETNNDDDGSMLCTHQHSELLLRRPLPPRTSKYYCVRYIYREACDV